VVAIDMCTVFKAAVRDSLPHVSTSARGWPQILAAITTGVTNAASEGINRAIKTDAVHLYANLRERVVSQVSPNPDREIHKGFI
jgi:transposase